MMSATPCNALVMYTIQQPVWRLKHAANLNLKSQTPHTNGQKMYSSPRVGPPEKKNVRKSHLPAELGMKRILYTECKGGAIPLNHMQSYR